jgi:hypothetical protein
MSIRQTNSTQQDFTSQTIASRSQSLVIFYPLQDLYGRIQQIADRIMQVASTSFPIQEASIRLEWIRREEHLIIQSFTRDPDLPNKRSISKACFYVMAPLTALLAFQKKFKHNLIVSLPQSTYKFIQHTLNETFPRINPSSIRRKFGEISLAESNGEYFALKSSSNANPAAMELLNIEACCLMTFNHPNIISVEAISYDGIFLELAKNGDLERILRSTDVTPEQLQQYILDIVEGLSYIHEKGFTHKDLKPENILISEGRAKLCDFGFTSPATEDRVAYGTPFYLSPETIRGVFSKQSDLWSLGVLIFKVITGGNMPYPTQPSPNDSKKTETNDEYVSRVSQITYLKPCDEKLIFEVLDQNEPVAALMKKRDPEGILRLIIIGCLHGDPKKRLSLARIKEMLRSSDPLNTLKVTEADKITPEMAPTPG